MNVGIVGPIIILLSLLPGCISGQPEITVEDAHAIIPMKDAVSVFMAINNKGNGEDTLLSAGINEYPNAKVELHEVKRGMMIKVDNIKIPARKTVVFKEGEGYHIMGFNVPSPPGEITLTLNFKKTGAVEVRVKVSMEH